MGRVSGKRFARGLAVAALVTLVWGAFASRNPLLEWWYLRKLDKVEELEKEEAARCLAGLRSARAVPRLIELFHLDREYRYWGYPSPLANESFGNTWSNAILRIGDRGVPALLEAAGSTDHQIRHIAFWCLFKLGPEAWRAVPSLLSMLEDRNPGVRTYAAEVLGALGPGVPPGIV